MDTYLLYDRVCTEREISHGQFLAYLEYTVGELCAMYGEDKVAQGTLHPLQRVGQTLGVYDEYAVCVLDNMLYLATGDERHKTDFTAHARYAYNTLWRKKNLRRRIKREVW